MKHLICPLCHEPLQKNNSGAGCSNHHQYDRAKEGYFNLLPVQHKHSREPGDSKEQLESRRLFLSSGFFAPLMDVLSNLIPASATHVLDIGCGEGSFTRLLIGARKDIHVYGIDIAKVGIKLAAKNCPDNFTYAVASSYLLPIASESMDIIVRIYAPSKDEELQRVLHAQGKLIIVTPGEQHLLGLRQKIYQQIKPYIPPKTPVGFSIVETHNIRFAIKVPAGDLTQALLHMTPFNWRLTEDITSLLVQTGLQDIADFQLTVYEKQRS